ncbi:GMC family oxidoreductase [Flavobacterium pectinovorum]|uniref:GMC family oxidoreductase n=1 Tax=Flavobacterium pectinovorum TaxID=29533 RepID=UPI001FADA8AE|nr:GMC oxidoreductase [Flavobacterium pectinovorum]MCI9843543.1 GMC family oxidoreductase N-terminal domain-containing protein [Flavobacterium pectinovorum]
MKNSNKSTADYDFIIVGGGSAGAVMASRLSENISKKILLIEGGNAYPAWDYPDAISSADNPGGDAAHNWGFQSEPTSYGNKIDLPRGKVLGGSSAINGAVALRARPEDFKKWNLQGWSFEEMLPYFKKLEKSDSGDKELHGFDGPLPVRQLLRSDLTSVQRAFVDSTINIGYKAVEDFDSAQANGVGPYRMNVVNGVRVNTGMAYLSNEVRERKNLTILSQSIADRVLFNGTKAIGILLANGEEFLANEIILSGGTYGSAAVLLRSGIGPKSQLEKLGIPLIAELPVGENVKDHPFHYAAFALHKEMVETKSPPIAAKLWTSAFDSSELDIHITATHLFPDEYSPTQMGFVLGVAVTTPLSKGKVWIETKDPNINPKVDLNFLDDKEDTRRMIEGAKIARRIAAAAPFSKFIHSEIAPGITVQTDQELEVAIKQNIASYAHPTSSAPMGDLNSKEAVVDLQGRVHQVESLRVVDASIFPDIISAATNITVIAVAEKIAEKIAQQNG